MTLFKSDHRQARKRRIRAKVQGTAERPRLTVLRTLTQMTVQLIDDESGKTVLAASTKQLKAKPNTDGAKALGEHVAKQAKDAKISAIVFDRNGYRYHGRVRELAEAMRGAGLTF